MTTQRTVVRRAPGKLFLLGEYAVLEPGHAAILAAINRHVTVAVSSPASTSPTTSTAPDVVIASDLCQPETQLRWRDGRLAGDTAHDDRRAHTTLIHIISAVEVMDDLLAERGLPTPAMRISITSQLHEAGTKLGLGSSGAVTVATVTAVANFCAIRLSNHARFRLALIATARITPHSSGGDLAASVWGGWLAYYAPDRTEILKLTRRRGIQETLRASWPDFGLRRLPPPDGLALQVGWTGTPASTTAQTESHNLRTWQRSRAHRSFLDHMSWCVRAAMRAFALGDRTRLLHEIRTGRHLLAQVDAEARLGIFTPQLTALCDAAEAAGAAAKPSGAGGGDCGIALLDSPTPADIAHLQTQWTALGVRPLGIHVPPLEPDDPPEQPT
ncbi:phosphomevalonate kinase [Amycolatopsis sp. NPDC051071]|uniref:phosphomevalonate kinase n=1 Tax=Amycolatopsis sp. NPDC051071 TaxID=3154637 RepID=UPI0034141614